MLDCIPFGRGLSRRQGSAVGWRPPVGSEERAAWRRGKESSDGGIVAPVERDVDEPGLKARRGETHVLGSVVNLAHRQPQAARCSAAESNAHGGEVCALRASEHGQPVMLFHNPPGELQPAVNFHP